MDSRIHNDEGQIEAAVRRGVGIAALRRLRSLVDAERAQDAAEARALPRMIALVVVVGLLLLLPLLWRLLG